MVHSGELHPKNSAPRRVIGNLFRLTEIFGTYTDEVGASLPILRAAF
jgi:hypothetical protein